MKPTSVLLALLLTAAAGCDGLTNSALNETPQKGGDGSAPELSEELQKPNEGEFSQEKLLANFGLNVVIPQTQEFLNNAQNLETQIQSYCDALTHSSDEEPNQENQAQEAWMKTMLSYHELEPLLIETPAIKEMKPFLYSYPYLNTCGIDQNVFSISQTGEVQNELRFNTQGLAALEYLLFDTELKPTCNAQAFPELTNWGNLRIQQRKQDRCKLSLKLSREFTNNAQTLHDIWSTDQQHYTRKLVVGSDFGSVKRTINAVTNALFAIETTKDDRLGKPLGKNMDCENESCPEAVEYKYAKANLEAIEAQILGFKKGFFGADTFGAKAQGFDDYLVREGHEEIPEGVQVSIERALKSLQILKARGPLASQIQAVDREACMASTGADRKEELCALHEDLRDIARYLKADVLLALSLEAPPTYQGDGDR